MTTPGEHGATKVQSDTLLTRLFFHSFWWKPIFFSYFHSFEVKLDSYLKHTHLKKQCFRKG